MIHTLWMLCFIQLILGVVAEEMEHTEYLGMNDRAKIRKQIMNGRKFFGEYSMVNPNMPINKDDKPNFSKLDELPGGILLRDVYEYNWFVQRFSPNSTLSRRSNTVLDQRYDHVDPNFGASFFRERLFAKGVVHYSHSGNFSDEEAKCIVDSLRTIEAASCIKFLNLITEQRHAKSMLFIRDENKECNCHSWSKKAVQEIYLGDICFNNHHRGVLHQVMHALGFEHMHRSYDRNHHLHVQWQNIEEDYMKEFEDLLPAAATLSVPYDHHSIMAVPVDYGSKNNEPTMAPLDWFQKHIGEKPKLSKKDKLKLQLVYSDQCMKRSLEFRLD